MMSPKSGPNRDYPVGNYGCSLGTDLALESLLGESETSRGTPPIKGYQALYVSIPTLYRNISNSLGKNRDMYASGKYAEVLIHELTIIEALISSRTNNQVQVYFYHCDYNSLELEYPLAKIIRPASDLQKFLDAIYKSAVKVVQEEFHGSASMLHVDTSLSFNAEKVVVLTSYINDLLSAKNLSHGIVVHLLESHTGTIKPQSKWYTKLKGDNDLMERIPLTKETLSVFGDGKLFGSKPIRVRRSLLDVANTKRWSQNTSASSVASSVKSCLKEADLPKK